MDHEPDITQLLRRAIIGVALVLAVLTLRRWRRGRRTQPAGGHGGGYAGAVDGRAGATELHAVAQRTRPRGAVARRVLLTLAVLSLITSLMSTVTGAVLTDRTTMATITTTGGTLDIVANGDASDTAVAYGGSGATITTDVSEMAPGDTAWGELTIDNAGTLPLTMTVSSTGSDTHPDQAVGHCFSYYFREVGSTGATGNGASVASPLNFTAMGTDTSPDSSTVLFETAVTARQLPDVAASSDDVWETDDTKTYRLTVRMRTECTQGGEGTAGAGGTLSFTFDASQT